MLKAPLDLSKSRVLLTNDDGIDADGFKVLERAMSKLAREVWAVAPLDEQSGAGHSLTLRRPLRILERGRRRFAVDGTPTDAVLLAINHVMKASPPDLVVSGINRGENLGEDVTYSGTIAAAMEGTILGFPSIALSQAVAGSTVNWRTAERHLSEVLARVLGQAWPRNVLINVNFPAVAPDKVRGVRPARQGRRKLGDELKIGHDPRGEAYYWIGSMRIEAAFAKGTDLDVVSEGAIAITPVHLDLTHTAFLRRLQKNAP